MAAEPRQTQRLSPDKLLLDFSKTRILHYVALAVVIHLVLIAATSVGYIRDRWIDPEGATRRKAAQLEARKAAEAKAAPPKPERAAAPKAEQKAIPEDRKQTPVVKEITELPKKGEIPKEPDDLGISIDETNK